ncbi:hypothetical protein NDU88_003660 [Pleurodeles waltl]|uniref:Uncharacterized protein n=1 Tax=Pleurodeles waltl TaxID=8319 RepID=A0AAV7Q9L3_PLEWA|nr:hypothetical protein NDU88_003660 [Pleurodeles waltl]
MYLQQKDRAQAVPARYTHSTVAALPPVSQLSDLRLQPTLAHMDRPPATLLLSHPGEEGAVKRSLMLYFGGAELYDMSEHLPNTVGDVEFDATVASLNCHFDPQLNVDSAGKRRVSRCLLYITL